MSKNHILIIEDEKDIAELLDYNLSNANYNTSVARNGELGIQLAREKIPDLILLDLMLPGIHGLDVCRLLKSDKKMAQTPIIMLTALGQEENIVKGLEVGADDYITKPFSFKILFARIKSVLRRGTMEENDENKLVEIHNIKINPRTQEVSIGEKRINLTFTEFHILHLFIYRFI